ncbi:LamG-like jellyroll fold domain-containing protein [Pelagibacterium luteolum]|uniref:Concanavalin A-like lectin/glucanases superfamily protein n=1 Tax=Pelagibacterium luteolum TaxID=440168 RepID=A0A1G7S4E1_9HYPH|nr:LamG-like jellyroll fold domain-containing protein [Pelagibacterium luteolum]SDG17030.1 Concanavalin A-like lectin/glucanases superfamily protein [Pelagibacterium luteolum]
MKRRAFLLGSVGSLGLPLALMAMEVEQKEAYVAPNGAGTGVSPDDPASITLLPELVARLGAGGTIFLLGGTYVVEEALRIATGGRQGAPVLIVGAARNGGRAVFEGNRRRWTSPSNERGAVDASEFGGNTLFRIMDDASHIYFANFEARHFGRVINLEAQRSRGITVEDVDFLNVRDGIYTDSRSACRDVTIRRFNGQGFSKKAIRFHGNSRDWLIEDCELDSRWQFGDQFAVGIEAHNEAHGLTIRGGFTINSLDNQGGDAEAYWNADGVASERGNYDIRIENHRSAGHSDSAYDLKSETTVLVGCVAEDSKRNYRLWGGVGAQPMILEDCASLRPRKRGGSGGAHHVWLNGGAGGERTAASIIFRRGRLQGGAVERPVLAEGGNVAAHFIDTEISGAGSTSEIFYATEPTSVLLLGSADGPAADTITSADAMDVISSTSVTMGLTADGPVSWRLSASDGGFDAVIDGDQLTVAAAGVGGSGTIVVVARDARGEAHTQTISVAGIANPVAEGVAFALALEDGAVRDATGVHPVVMSEGAMVEDGAFVFDENRSFFEVQSTPVMLLTGPFFIRAEFALDQMDYGQPPDIVTRWASSGHERSFRLGLNEANAICFYWSSSGRLQEENILVGPVLVEGQRYSVAVERDAAGRLTMSVDGSPVASTPGAVEELFEGNAPLRVSGRPDGERGLKGRLYDLALGVSV